MTTKYKLDLAPGRNLSFFHCVYLLPKWTITLDGVTASHHYSLHVYIVQMIKQHT